MKKMVFALLLTLAGGFCLFAQDADKSVTEQTETESKIEIPMFPILLTDNGFFVEHWYDMTTGTKLKDKEVHKILMSDPLSANLETASIVYEIVGLVLSATGVASVTYGFIAKDMTWIGLGGTLAGCGLAFTIGSEGLRFKAANQYNVNKMGYKF